MSTHTSQPPTNARHIVLVVLCAAAMIAYFSRNILGVASDVIQQDLDLSDDQMGLVMGWGFFLSYSFMQIPGGLLGARYGSRYVLTSLAIIWAIGTAAMGATVGFWTLFVAYFVVGIAQAGLFPCTTISFSHWLSPGRRGFGGGSLTSSMSVGGAVALALTGFLLESVSWRWICVIFGVPAILWAIGFFIWFRDRPEEHAEVNEAELEVIRGDRPHSEGVTRGASKSASWGTLLSKPVMWLICGQQFFRAAGYIFIPTWFPRYLRQTWDVSTDESGYLSSIALWSVVVGAVVGGAAVDWILKRTGSRWLSRPGFALASTSACAICFFLVYLSPSLTVAMVLFSAGAFCQAMAAPCTFAVNIEVGGSSLPKLYSTMNMSGNFGAALCPFVVARFVSWTDGAWELVPVFFCGVYVASALCWIFVNPNRQISD